MGREGARKGKIFIAISMLPDVCNTPMGSMMVPVPYTVTANLDESIGVSRNVFFGGAPAFTLNKSTVPRVRGDEAGTGRGVKSGGHMGKVEPIEGDSNVLVNGNPVVRHGDRCKMNDGNTIGKIYCTDAARPGCGISNGKPTGDTNPPFFNRTSAGTTSSPDSNVLHQAKGFAIGAKDAVVDMAQGAWDVAEGTGRLLNPETAAAQAEEIRKAVSGIAHDPKALWEAIIQPYAEAIAKGDYGNALGRGLVDVGSLFLGGIGGAGKAGEAASVAAKSGKGVRAAVAIRSSTAAKEVANIGNDGVVVPVSAKRAAQLKGGGVTISARPGKVRSAEEVNAEMVVRNFDPAWKEGTRVIEREALPGERFKMVVDSEQREMLEDGNMRGLGGWASSDEIPNQSLAREKLAITDKYKEDVSYVAEVQIVKRVPVQDGVAGQQGVLSGGGRQIYFNIPPAQRGDYIEVLNIKSLPKE